MFDSNVATNQVNRMALSAGGLLLTGPFQGAVDFGGGPLMSAGGDNRFLAVLDPSNGGYRRAARFGGTGDDDNGSGLAVADDGATFVGGGCDGNDFDFGSGPLAGSDRDPCLARFSAAGAFEVQRRWTDPGRGGLVALAAAGDDVIAAGYYNSALHLDRFALTPVGASDAFVARLGPDLVAQWIVPVSSDGADFIPKVVRRADGALFVAGGGDDGVLSVGARTVSLDGDDGFVAMLDPDGTPRWVHPTGAVNDLAVHDGVVFVAGSFAGTLSLDGVVLTSAGNRDAYLAAFDADTGGVLWAERFGGPLADEARVVAAGPDQLVFAGYSTGPTELGDLAGDGLFIAAQRY